MGKHNEVSSPLTISGIINPQMAIANRLSQELQYWYGNQTIVKTMYFRCTLWIFNIAMENASFLDDFPS